MALSAMNNLYTVFTSFRINLREVFSFCASHTFIYAVAGQRMQVTFHWRHALLTSPTFWKCLHFTFQVSFCRFTICNNKSQLLLHPYMPSHLINLKNQLRYRLLNMWKLFCVRLLSSFLVTNDNKVALAVVHRKKLQCMESQINNYENFVVFQ